MEIQRKKTNHNKIDKNKKKNQNNKMYFLILKKKIISQEEYKVIVHNAFKFKEQLKERNYKY